MIRRQLTALPCLAALIVAQSAAANSVATEPQWLALLHMRPALAVGWVSEVDREDFFLSGKKNDPQAELAASLAQWSRAEFHCKYPARSQYLSRALNKPVADFSACAELQAFRAQFPDDGLTLVYPEPYLQDIASIFGHSFLRVDSNTEPALLAPSISYYADVEQSGGVAGYVAKGLAGGFPGVFVVTPYFRNLRDYTVGEDRDIYEYRLNYQPQEIRLLVDHLWEVNGSSFDYFFLDENCSYRLIALLDAVAAPHNLRQQFGSHALPLDTVKVLDQVGRVAKMEYVPSARKRFEAGLARLNTEQRELLEKEIAGQPQGLEPVRLDLAAQQRAIAMRQNPGLRAKYSQEVQRLLLRQGLWSEVNESPLPKPVQPTAVDPAREAHGYKRVSVSAVHADGNSRLHINLRPAYHDFLDPAAGFQANVQLRVLETEFSVNTDGGADDRHNDVQLEKLNFFSLAHYQPATAYFSSSAWGFDISRERLWLGDRRPENNRLAARDRLLVNRIGAYTGYASHCGPLTCFADLTADLYAGSGLDLGWTAALGARFGALYTQGKWRAEISAQAQRFGAGEQQELLQGKLGVSYQLARNVALVAEIAPAWSEGARREQYSVGARFYFD